MSNNAQKVPFARAMNQFAEDKILDALSMEGSALPCHVVAVSGSIVTVQFDVTGPYTLPQVTCPMAGAEYIRFPMQIGDQGYVQSADVYLGGMSGLGGGTATFAVMGNLSALVFVPFSNTGVASKTAKPWPTDNIDPDALTMYSASRITEIDLHKTGAITTRGEEFVDGSVSTTGNLSTDTGATGTFQSFDGQTIMVISGIIVSIT